MKGERIIKIRLIESDKEDDTERNNHAGADKIDKHDFSMRSLAILMEIVDLDKDEDTCQELRNKMKRYCDMATEEFNNNNFDIAQQHLLHAEYIHCMLKKQRRDLDNPEFKRNFLERKNILLFSIFKLADVESEHTKKIKDEIKSYCDIAFKEFVNKNFHIARQHLSRAEKIHSKFLNRRNDACPTSNGRSNETDEKVDKLLKGNEEVKERCLGIAQEAINNGNFKEADMFLLISQSFCITDIPKLSQTLLDCIKSNDSKHANHKKDSPKENSVAESRSGIKDTKATNAALVVNKKPLEIPRPESARSDKDQKVNAAASAVSETTQIHKSSTPNKTSNSHESVPKPMVDVSKNHVGKSAEAGTSKKILKEMTAIEQVAKEKAANEQAAKEKAAKEKAAKEEAEKEKAANEQAAKERAAKEKAAKEQETKQAIERINAATNDHDRLGVGRQATLKEVSTAYHRLALLLHPDKNRAPGVTEAYMTVTHAYKSLEKKLKAAKKKGFS